MVKKKGTSKRTGIKQKYKIERRVKEHQRKKRKAEKKNPKLLRRKDPGIPASMPAAMKEQVLAEIEFTKKRAEEQKLLQKEKRRAEVAHRRGLGPPVEEASPAPMSALEKMVQAAALGQQAFAAGHGGQKEEERTLKEGKLGQQSRRAFLKELHKVIEASDVILQVLDARDPMGSRSEAVEEAILRHPTKKLVLVMNKVDLVPKKLVSGWLEYLRKYFPALAFKASTQEGGSLQQQKGDALLLLSFSLSTLLSSIQAKASASALKRSGSVGTEALMGLLKNYCRSLNIKTSITVGVIGYPNVGKSSLINSLKRSKAVGVSATPGFTRSMQPVQLDKLVKLLDCPGIVFDDSDSSATLLKNCVDIESLPDPTAAVEAVMERCSPEQLMEVYAIPRYASSDVNSFLAAVAKKKGKILKGGVPDRMAAGRLVLRDWNTGAVPFFTTPPEEEEMGEACLVSQFGKEFDPSTLYGDADKELNDAMADEDDLDYIAMKSGGRRAGAIDMEDEEEVVEEEEEAGANKGKAEVGKDAKKKAAKAQLRAMKEEEESLNPQLGKAAKKRGKAAKKAAKKQAKQKAAQMDVDGNDVGKDEAYSFEKDFYGKQEGKDGNLSSDSDL
ncbi:unnamed protein product [Chrysoparadoxa australica]